ncbi:MAG: purine-binding chemotaxis protein CheW [Gammaproteobacteria bacterium]|nr:purine-binding chemotaxis protein CheW [Gammaproteobacteria bacterium]
MPIKHKKQHTHEITQAIDYFPNKKEVANIFAERANSLAKQSLNKIQKNETDAYITFYLGDTEEYAIDYHYVKEVTNNIHLTKLPCTLPYIAGVINKRGELLTVLDLKYFLYNQAATHNQFNIILIDTNNITFGVLVDRIIGNKNYNKNSLDNAFPSENIAKTEYILGLHDGKVTILNMQAIITDLVSTLSKDLIS